MTLSQKMPRERLTRRRLLVIGAVLIAAVIVIGPLAPIGPRQVLQFNTIAEGDSFGSEADYSGSSPDFVVITKPNQIDNHPLGVVLPDDIRARFVGLDFSNSYAVLLFRGRRGDTSPAYAISVVEITHKGGVIDIHAVAGELGPGQGSAMMFSSPYHFVYVQSDEGWRKWALIRLIVNGAAVRWHLAWLP